MLDDKDLEFVGILQSLNVPRNVATLITYLANTDEVTSREIEIWSNLRQPEVSTGMRTLRQNNWVEERDIKSKEKGRPVRIYKLGVPIEEIIKHYEDVKNSESTQAMESIQKLREMTVIWSEGNFRLNYFCTPAHSFLGYTMGEAVSNVTSNDLHDRNSAFGFPLSYHILAIGGGTICG